MKDINLIDSVLAKNSHFESGILCTYGLNLNFFENYLMKLDGLYSCDNISIFTDASTYDGFIKESYNPRWLNKKYLVNRLKSDGVFHPKLYMFASPKKAVVGIGSANLTRDGIASNLEILTVFEVSEKDLACAHILRDCIDYVRRLAQITKSESAIDQVDTFSQICMTYLQGGEDNGVRFVHNIDQPLIQTIKERATGSKINKIQVLSPFYDSELKAYKMLREIYPDCTFEIYLQQKKSNFPKEMFSSLKSNASLFLYKDVDRYMHGKAIALHSDKAVLLYAGSANFTRSALTLIPPAGNYEIGLLGEIEQEKVRPIFCPNGKRAKKIKRTEEIEVTPGNGFAGQNGFIEYITEAVLKNDLIKISVNTDISQETFRPARFRIQDFNDNVHLQDINEDFSVKLTTDIKKKIPGKMAVQVLGRDEKDNSLESNISWVIELEEKSGDSLRRRFQRIYNDPFELIAVLREILERGDEKELRLFLLNFDIPLDLILPPRNQQRPAGIESKGNIEGGLPKHGGFPFSAGIKDAYAQCLNRLYQKLERHKESPQVNKINNFVTILSSLHSLIWFINTESISEKFKNVSFVTPDEWALIRAYYDMLFMYLDQSWDLIWSKGGYRDVINAKIAKERRKDQEKGPRNFEQHLAEEYNYIFEELVDYAFKTMEHFLELKDRLLVKTVHGQTVKPPIFKSNNRYLQPEAINKITAAIEQHGEIFRRI